jgi:hypothetical protein
MAVGKFVTSKRKRKKLIKKLLAENFNGSDYKEGLA